MQAHLLSEVLQIVSAGALGVFAGAMLTEGLVLVPYWRSLAPREFFAWYAANDRRLLGFFGPLTSATALLAVAAALAALWDGHPGRGAAALAAVLAVSVVATFFVYFRRANEAFAAGAIRPESLPAELARWAAWHHARTGVSVAALASSLVAVWLGI